MLKPAFLKNEAFLADITRTLRSKDHGLWWLGQSGFLVVQQGRALLLDPYLSDSLTRKYEKTDKPHTRITEQVVNPTALAALGAIEVITSSHNHTDHFDPETLQPLLAENSRTRLLIPAANRQLAIERLPGSADRLLEIDAGQSVTVADIRISAVPSAHPTIERDAAGRCRFLGYVVQWAGVTIYHSGDTLWHDDLVSSLRPFRIDLALLPINGDRPERKVAGNLDGRQAAQLAHAIGAGSVIPCHYDLFEFNTASPDEFVAECERLGQPHRVLCYGEGWAWNGAPRP
jgi:L-ascorbate metabolism protein UlaG (beta-lactamase superfamily)